MSEEKKVLQSERKLLSCGFTHKDIRMIYERAALLMVLNVSDRISCYFQQAYRYSSPDGCKVHFCGQHQILYS